MFPLTGLSVDLMNNEQETQYIHQLLDLMKDRPYGYYVAEDGMIALKFSRQDYPVLMRRLEEEKLATRQDGTRMILTSNGMTIARGPGGYNGYQAEQQRQQQRKSTQEGRSATGSYIGGIAGVLGVIIALFSFWDSHQTAGELDSLRQQVQQLTQTQAATQARLAVLEAKPAPAATSARPHQNQASTPSRLATKKSPAPTPARKPAL